jgi:hypothetical protein
MSEAPERIWVDEDTWFAGPGKTERAKEYVHADLVSTLIRDAEARGMERVGEFISGSWILPRVAKDRLLDQIRAAASAIRKVEETPK